MNLANWHFTWKYPCNRFRGETRVTMQEQLYEQINDAPPLFYIRARRAAPAGAGVNSRERLKEQGDALFDRPNAEAPVVIQRMGIGGGGTGGGRRRPGQQSQDRQ